MASEPAGTGVGTRNQGPISSTGWGMGWPTGDRHHKLVPGQCSAGTLTGNRPPCECKFIDPEKTDPLDPERRTFCESHGPQCGGKRMDGQRCSSWVVNPATWTDKRGYLYGHCMELHDPRSPRYRSIPGRQVLDPTAGPPVPPGSEPATAANAGEGAGKTAEDAKDIPEGDVPPLENCSDSDVSSIDTRADGDAIFDRRPAPAPHPVAPAANPAMDWQLAALALAPIAGAAPDEGNA